MGTKVLLSAASLLLIFSAGLLFAACGDDASSAAKPVSTPGSSSSGSTTSGGSATGSDEQYVASICKASATMKDSIAKARGAKAPAGTNIYAAPFSQMVADLKAAKPPQDAKDYHDQLLKAFSDMATAITKDGGTESFANVGDIPTPPPAVSDRLQKIALKNADCAKAGFSFD